MPRFFTDKPADDIITVTGSDAVHMGYSLRMKVGDPVTFCHSGTDYFCRIESMNGTDRGEVEVVDVESGAVLKSYPLTFFPMD